MCSFPVLSTTAQSLHGSVLSWEQKSAFTPVLADHAPSGDTVVTTAPFQESATVSRPVTMAMRLGSSRPVPPAVVALLLVNTVFQAPNASVSFAPLDNDTCTVAQPRPGQGLPDWPGQTAAMSAMPLPSRSVLPKKQLPLSAGV